MRPHASSPINKPKPMRIKVTVPIQKSIRFFIMMLPLFLALAKPACIRNTGAAPIKNHTAKSCSFVSYVTSSLIVSFILNHSKTKRRQRILIRQHLCCRWGYYYALYMVCQGFCKFLVSSCNIHCYPSYLELYHALHEYSFLRFCILPLTNHSIRLIMRM